MTLRRKGLHVAIFVLPPVQIQITPIIELGQRQHKSSPEATVTSGRDLIFRSLSVVNDRARPVGYKRWQPPHCCVVMREDAVYRGQGLV